MLRYIVLVVAVLASSVQAVDIEQECYVDDYIQGERVFVRQEPENKVANRLYTHARLDSNGDQVTVYFTPCGALPKSITSQCGITDDHTYTFIEIFEKKDRTQKKVCIERRHSEIVTARYFKHSDHGKLELLYKDPQAGDLVVMRFMLKQTPNITKVEFSTPDKKLLFHSKKAYIFTAEIETAFVEFHGAYFFSLHNQIFRAAVGVAVLITFVFCAFYFNHLREYKGFYPFNFYVNTYVAYKLADFSVSLFLPTAGYRWFTTLFILAVPPILGFLLERLGPAVTYRKTLYFFYALCLFDCLVMYVVESYVVLALGVLQLLLTILAVRLPQVRKYVHDSGEWVVSVFMALNLFNIATHLLMPLKNYGAFRMWTADVTEYYAHRGIALWLMATFVAIPLVAYLRYRFSDRLIQLHYEKITDKMDTVIRLTSHTTLAKDAALAASAE